jgi:quinol monooxygenase YgiN
VLVMTRVRVPDGEADAFRTGAEDLLDVLAGLPGFVRGHLGRAPDEPALWVLSTEWEGVGAYRRALSSYDVKVAAPVVLAHAVQEPSAYEVLASR